MEGAIPDGLVGTGVAPQNSKIFCFSSSLLISAFCNEHKSCYFLCELNNIFIYSFCSISAVITAFFVGAMISDVVVVVSLVITVVVSHTRSEGTVSTVVPLLTMLLLLTLKFCLFSVTLLLLLLSLLLTVLLLLLLLLLLSLLNFAALARSSTMRDFSVSFNSFGDFVPEGVSFEEEEEEATAHKNTFDVIHNT